ncbi:MAG: protein kinase [Anaerolineae bacterium]
MADSPRERYRLERKISGKGSFGEIWLATDTLLDRPVVIKCPKATDDPIRRERFLVEARMLARLNHPNITQIYDAFFDEGEGNLYLVIEYVDGRDLAEIIGAGTPLPLDIVLEIATGILKALSYAHEQGLVHRDIKSANVMIADDVKLTDFGLASLQSILKRGIGFVAGTPAYMAPEQIEGRAIDGRADLYALGVLLFEVISGGRLPFEYTDNDAMLDAHLHVAPPPLSQFAPMVPPVLEQVVARLLVKEPEERYPSAGAVLEVLDSIQVGPKVGNLPVSLTPFVGREAELAGIQERLKDPDCRLLTLVGLGGSGKTRLALEAAATQADDYPDGVFFVPLASLESVEGIVPTVAEALGFRFYEESEPRQQLLDYLRQKHMLIILDNFEQLVEGVGLVTDILQTAPGVKILDTSRIRLNVQGEHLFPVAGMEFPGQEKAEDAGWDAALRRAPQPVDQPALTASPGDGQDVAQYSAVKLFLQSARRVQPSFELTIDDILDVAHICALVDGMPLAILLATAWTEIMTPAEIKGQIRQSLDFLETNLRDVPPRQRSMRVVFDHSWNLLTEREREVFAGLSVFRGGFTRDAAQKVSDASLRDLMALVHKSLLHPTASGRYDMHQLLRVYAAEKLEILGETEVAREAHTAYYAEFLFQREEDLKGRRQLEALDEIEVDFENARTAWNWALKCKNFTAIGQSQRSLSWFCTFRSRSQEHKELLQRAREQLAPGPSDEPHPVWGRNLVAESYLGTDDFDIGQIERVLAIAQKFGKVLPLPIS